jgi:hypothetical protein
MAAWRRASGDERRAQSAVATATLAQRIISRKVGNTRDCIDSGKLPDSRNSFNASR